MHWDKQSIPTKAEVAEATEDARTLLKTEVCEKLNINKQKWIKKNRWGDDEDRYSRIQEQIEKMLSKRIDTWRKITLG